MEVGLARWIPPIHFDPRVPRAKRDDAGVVRLFLVQFGQRTSGEPEPCCLGGVLVAHHHQFTFRVELLQLGNGVADPFGELLQALRGEREVALARSDMPRARPAGPMSARPRQIPSHASASSHSVSPVSTRTGSSCPAAIGAAVSRARCMGDDHTADMADRRNRRAQAAAWARPSSLRPNPARRP